LQPALNEALLRHFAGQAHPVAVSGAARTPSLLQCSNESVLTAIERVE